MHASNDGQIMIHDNHDGIHLEDRKEYSIGGGKQDRIQARQVLMQKKGMCFCVDDCMKAKHPLDLAALQIHRHTPIDKPLLLASRGLPRVYHVAFATA